MSERFDPNDWDQWPDKPFHQPNCAGKCEGGGWVPGPTRQFEMAMEGKRMPVLSRCLAGPEITWETWGRMKAARRVTLTDSAR